MFKSIFLGSSIVEIGRSAEGVVHIKAEDEEGIQKGLGYIHAQDRLTQMFLSRLVASGEITRYLFDSDEGFAIDHLIRKMGIHAKPEEEIKDLSDQAKKWCLAYCEGINAYLEKEGPPLFFKFLKIPIEPWSLQDTVKLIKMQMYLGLGQVQERTEKFIIQAVYEGVNIEHLKKIFYPHLNAVDSELVHLIKNARLESPYLDRQLHFEPAFSNNWALAGNKTLSGLPLCAHDPHLQINRLPSFWYEAIIQTPEDFLIGITIPGSPGIIMGRSHSLYASFTYGMMDTLDFFIENIANGCVQREGGEKPLALREEIIQRKKRGSVSLKFFESECGVIERKDDRNDTLQDGLYFSLKWSCAHGAIAPLINSMAQLWKQHSAFKAGEVVRDMSLSCNWVLADLEGNIAYQQSGRLPQRAHSGLFPLPAWLNANHWKGYVSGAQLSASYNPPCGFVVSANDDKNQPGKPLSINLPYADYRYRYIYETLSQNKTFSLEDMKQLQCDIYSLQAKRFLEELKDFIPATQAGNILKAWDYRYTIDSQGATLFEAFYFALLEDVFGKVFGLKAWKQIAARHSLLMFTHGNFDRTLWEDEGWFGNEGRQACFQRVLEATLAQFSSDIPTWGSKNQFTMTNLFFNGRLPKFLGFDLGPLEMPGNRATVAASVIFQDKKRGVAVGATYRCVTDLSTPEAFTILAGGPSEKRFSKFYSNDVAKWLGFEYKHISLS